MKYNKRYLLYIISFLFFHNISAQNQPIELGIVQWERNYEKSLAKAKLTDKNILILFQEVPGCNTCQKYGSDILSNPLIAEVIETYFIPLAIFNNKNGPDKKVLARYNEPSWNNPVLRIVDSNGDNIEDRLSGKYTKLAVIDYIHDHLSKVIHVPEYIKLLQEELYLEQGVTKEISFSMYCFWTGEKELGSIPGVLNTTAGFMDGKEVVTVKYSPNIISTEQLINKAKSKQCATAIYSNEVTDPKLQNKYSIKRSKALTLDKEQNYYLKHSKYNQIPMFDLQATRVNSLLGNHKNPEALLSPRQLVLIK